MMMSLCKHHRVRLYEPLWIGYGLQTVNLHSLSLSYMLHQVQQNGIYKSKHT